MIFSNFSCFSGLDILSSYFISFIVRMADIGQVKANITLIIALIINITFSTHFNSNHHDYIILDYHV